MVSFSGLDWVLYWLNLLRKKILRVNRLKFLRKSFSSTRDTINVAPNVSRFVFWITGFFISVIFMLVSTESFVEFFLTQPCSKIILTFGLYVDPSRLLFRHFEVQKFPSNHGSKCLFCTFTVLWEIILSRIPDKVEL